MTDPHQQIPEIFDAAHQNLGECARVAILGPRLSGKTELLDSVSGTLRVQAGARLLQVRLDLAVERFGGFDDPARQLASSLRQNEKLREELRRTPKLILPPSGTLSEVVEALLVGLPGRHVLLEIDHLEAAPLYFARALAEQLHPLLDVGVSRDNDAAQRLGLLVCGSINLHNLLDAHKSGFIHCKPIHALTGDPDVRVAAVTSLTLKKWESLDSEVVQELARWTGGEPAFVRPLLAELTARKPTEIAVRKAAKQIGGVRTRLQVLRELAMEVHREPALRALVASAIESGEAPVAPPLSAPGEISVAELSGVFVVYNGRYEFRNALVEYFITQLFNESRRLSPWSSNDGAGRRMATAASDDAMRLPLHVEGVARAMAAEASVWPIIPHLADLWRAMMPAYPEGKITVLVHVEGGWHRLDGNGHKVVPIDDGADLVLHVAKGARLVAERVERRPAEASNVAFFNGDDGRLAVGVPVGPPARMVAVVTTVPRQLRGAAWSEPSLRNWIWFLRRDAGSNLGVRAAVEVLQHLCAGKRGLPAFQRTLSGVLEELHRVRGEMIVQMKLDRFSGRFQRWATPMLNGASAEKIIAQIQPMLPQYEAEWTSIRDNEVADVQRAVMENLPVAVARDVVEAVGAIAVTVENITAAFGDLAMKDLIQAARELRDRLARATALAHGTPAKLEQIIAMARGRGQPADG